MKISTYLAAAAALGIAVGSPAFAAPSADGAALLKSVASSINAAKRIDFVATATSVGAPGAPKSTDRVSGVVQAPNWMKVSAAPVGDASSDPVVLYCDGTTYAGLDRRTNVYSTGPAPKQGLETDSPYMAYFMSNALGESGSTADAVASLFLPVDLLIADQISGPSAPKIPMTIKSAVVGGVRCTDVVQTLAQPGGTMQFQTFVDPATRGLIGMETDSLDGGKVVQYQRIVFSKLRLSNAARPASEFAFSPPPGSKLYPQPALPGSVAPAFEVEAPDGHTVSLSDYAGKVVVIDFWATWCGPCKETLPHTNALAGTYAGKPVVFLAICSWDDKANFDAWVKSHQGWNVQWLFDPAGQNEASSIAAGSYGVTGIPTQYVIGKDGKVVYGCFAGAPHAEKALAAVIDEQLTQ